MVSQACATAVAALHSAAASVVTGGGTELVITADRTSNGPTMVYPRPSAAGGTPAVEDFVQSNFARDPWAGTSMLAAAETVARERGVSREELDDVAALRYQQYQHSLAEDRRFQRAYMVPVELVGRRGNVTVIEDAGIRPVDRESISALPPAITDGVAHRSLADPSSGRRGGRPGDNDRASAGNICRAGGPDIVRGFRTCSPNAYAGSTGAGRGTCPRRCWPEPAAGGRRHNAQPLCRQRCRLLP